MLDPQARAELLSLARKSIESCLRDTEKPSQPPTLPCLLEKCGAFVTLHQQEDLRGCIGYTQPRMPLWETVREVAALAASDDPRFEPIRREELGSIRIEISVLTPMERVTDAERIVIGTHGLYVKHGRHSGILLPQVAPEWGWDRVQFLEHTCQKAGLPRDAWKDPSAELYWFTAEVFGDPA